MCVAFLSKARESGSDRIGRGFVDCRLSIIDCRRRPDNRSGVGEISSVGNGRKPIVDDRVGNEEEIVQVQEQGRAVAVAVAESERGLRRSQQVKRKRLAPSFVSVSV